MSRPLFKTYPQAVDAGKAAMLMKALVKWTPILGPGA
jgi:hypothetical protein